jgi:hypothetical protein
VIFPISENEIEAQGATFLEHRRDPGRIAGRDEDAHFHQCFRSWKSRRDRGTNAQGDYFERDGGE